MRVLFSFFLFLISYAAYAQLDPVNWSFDVQQVNDQEFDVIFTADIAHGWTLPPGQFPLLLNFRPPLR